jgi:transcriptional regulator EpsA
VNQLSAREREVFLRVFQDSLAIDCRQRLFSWLRGDLQRLLPHDVLLAVVGHASTGRVRVDVVSANAVDGAPGCPSCRHDLIPHRLFDRWKLNQCQMLSIDGSIGGLINETCDCSGAAELRGLSRALVHGLRDRRTGEDALYVVVGGHPASVERQRAMFALLLPQIDFACRRVEFAAAPGHEGGRGAAAPVAEPGSDVAISTREHEVLGWVRAGKTNYEIGRILNISTCTVKNHLQRIYRKIDVINRAQAVAKFDEYARSR